MKPTVALAPLFFLLLLACGGLGAQTSTTRARELKFRHINTDNGLTNSSGTAIIQDRDGFMWIGTRNGLNRYDGLHFTHFQRDDSDSTSLSNNRIEYLYLSKAGDLWVGTDRGLNRYLPGRGFVKYLHDPGDPTSISHNTVFGICEDPDGRLWVATRGGLNRLDPARGTFERFLHDPDRPASLMSDFVKAVYRDRADDLWVITNRGIDKLPRGGRDFVHYPQEELNLKDANIPMRNALLEDGFGTLWAGQYNGLWRYDAERDRFLRYQAPAGPGPDVQVRELVLDERGQLWAGTYEGLFLIDTATDECTYVSHSDSNPYSLSQNSVHAIYQDRAGNFWVGTWSGAINYLDRDFSSFTHYGKASGLSYHVVSGFAEAAGGNFWVGTEGGGLNYFDRSTGQFTVYRNRPGDRRSLGNDNIQGMLRRRDGSLAIATHGGGLSLLPADAPAGRFTVLRNVPDDPTSLPANYLKNVFEDSQGRLWVVPSVKELAILNPDGRSFTRFAQEGDEAFGTLVLTEDRQQRIWAGTERGLGLVDPLAGRIDLAAVAGLNEQITSSVISLFQDENQDFWIGTEGDGLFRLRSNLSEFTNYRVGDGLPSNTVFAICGDGRGYLWMSTISGLARMDPARGSFETFDVDDGLQSNEFNYDACHRAASGELLFGGVNGFNIFDPATVEPSSYQPPLVITGLNVREQPLPLSACAGTAERPVVLHHDQNPFSFDFVALDFSQPERTSYAYRLRGQDEDWLDIGNRRHRTFTNIGAGDYVFQVRAGDQTADFHLSVLPPWWRTWWAYLLYLLVAAGFGYLVWAYARERRADRNALKREKMEREQMEELNQLKMQFFTNVSHELRTPLTLIMGPLERLLKRQEKLDEEQLAEVRIVHSNANRLLQHVNRLMDFRKEEMGKMKLRAAEGNFLHFLKETSLSFQEIATHRGIDYSFTADRERAEIYYDRDKLEIVIFNLLSNAFKFTADGGRISIEASVVEDEFGEANCLRFAVRDSGTGIAEEDVPHVFDRFYQGREGGLSSGVRKGSGIGLALSKQLVELHHGSISVRSQYGQGSEFFVTLPCGRDHLNEDEILANFKKSDDSSQYARSETPVVRADRADRDKTLLVVEDNPDIRDFIVSCFAEEYRVLTAGDGSEGFEVATHRIPDLIISDIMMPETDGITLCSMLKKDLRTSHIPVILLTARTSVIFKRSGLESGADDYVTKPFTSNMLQLRVRNLLDARKKMQAYFVRNNKVNPEEVILTSQDDEFLASCLKCVEEHLGNSEFNVEAFVRHMGMSRSVLYKKLKGLTGQSITEFVRSIRIKRAGQLLLQDRYNISEVAYTVGFSDLKYFRSCFRKQFQMSPSQYIAAHKDREVV